MLELARDRSAGAHTYAVTPQHTADARERLGPDAVLAVEVKIALTDDRDDGLGRARAHLEVYLGLPNYRASWLRQGFTEDDLAAGGSDRFLDGLVAIGDEAVAASLIREHFDAGASHVCLQPLGADGAQVAREDYRRLAPLAREL
jgi:probable F420-dependent oxidoreductase